MIDKERLLEEFFKLSAINAHSFEERKKTDYLTARLQSLGFSVQEDQAGSQYGGNAGNLYAYKEGELKGAPLLFSAHMDTVAPGNGIKASINEEGNIVSDGTTILGADDNSGLSAILEAIESIQQRKTKHRNLELLFTIGEEAYLKGSEVFDYEKIRAKQAYVLDLCGKVGTAAICAPTVLAFTVKITGKASHAGFAPEKGINAIEIASKIITRIKQGRLDEETTVNIGCINGGVSTNIVSEECIFRGEVRSLNNEKAQELMKHLEITAQEEVLRSGAKYQIDSNIGSIAYRIDENAQVIQNFEKTCRKLNVEPIKITTMGGSDNNNFALHGIDGIVLACAMEQVHSCQEYAQVEELEKITEIVYQLMTIEV